MRQFLTPKQRAERIMDGIANNVSSLQDVTDEIRAAMYDAVMINRMVMPPPEGDEMNTRTVTIEYVNYRGEHSTRQIVPHTMYWGQNQWHPEPQWLLEAWDIAKDELRTFAVKDIKEWRPDA